MSLIRHLITLLFLLGVGWVNPANAQQASESDATFAIGEFVELSMRRLRSDERSGHIKADNPDDDLIWVTNACGKARAEFEILETITALPKRLTFERTMGEWCEPPFDFSKTYRPHFLIISGGKVVDAILVLPTNDGRHVLAVDEGDIEDWADDWGASDPRLNVVSLSHPIRFYKEEYPGDPYVRTFVDHREDLAFFYDENNQEYIGLTRGVYLDTMFSFDY